MKNVSYYRILTDTDNNFANNETFLQVNCAGHSYYLEEVRGQSTRRDVYLLYLCKGKVDIYAPHTGRPLTAGEAILFTPDTPFHYFKPAGREMEYYWVHFTGSGCRELMQKCGLRDGVILSIGVEEGIKEKFRKLFQVFLSRDAFFETEAAEKLVSLLITMGKFHAGSGENAPATVRIGTALRMIHENLSDEISVAELAAAEHLSISHFRTVFKSATGLSPKAYAVLTKLSRACELLRQTDCSIQAAGAQVGYDDPQYFSRIFSRHIGVSPAVYRGQMRQKN